MSHSAFIALAAVSTLSLVSAAPSTAATFRVSTAPGRSVTVSNEAAWDRACSSTGNPVYSFTQPTHGMLSTRPKAKVIQTCDAGGCQCKGHPISGLAVIYTPERGFHGIDRFDYASTFPNGVVLKHQAIVTVK